MPKRVGNTKRTAEKKKTKPRGGAPEKDTDVNGVGPPTDASGSTRNRSKEWVGVLVENATAKKKKLGFGTSRGVKQKTRPHKKTPVKTSPKKDTQRGVEKKKKQRKQKGRARKTHEG